MNNIITPPADTTTVDLAAGQGVEGRRGVEASGIVASAELARLQAELVQLVDTTRNEIGRELHDSVQQQLTGLHYLAHELVEAMKTTDMDQCDTATIHEFASKATRLARGIGLALNEIHELACGLVPSLVTPDSLVAALAELAQSVSQRTPTRSDRRLTTNVPAERITCRFQARAAQDVPDSRTATHLYRIAQEAVTNAIKHGKCSRIEIRFEYEAGEFRLEVCDNGRGIEQRYVTGNGHPATERSKLGLKSMCYRAGAIGGTLRVDRPVIGGTRVCCVVPRATVAGE